VNRVLVLTRGLPLHHVGGMESVAWDLSRELARRVPVTVVTTSVPDRPVEFTLDGVRVLALPGTPAGRYSSAWWSGSRRALARELHGGDVRGVLSVSAAAYSGLDLVRAAGARSVLQAHGTSVMELSSKLATRRPRQLLGSARNVLGLVRDVRTYHRFDEVVAVGPAVAASLSRWPLGAAARVPDVTVVPNGIDTTVFRPVDGSAVRAELGLPAGAVLLLSAGRLHPQKRVDRVLDGLARLDGGFHLAIVGDGPEERALRSRAGELGVSGRVHFVGGVDRDRLLQFYSAADVNLLTTSRREVGVPMVVLESLACGTPSVVPDTAAGPASTRGVVPADVSDPAALAAAVRELTAGLPAGPLLPPEHDLRVVADRYAAVLGVV
jgi:glycosyltransferase involved in cell wall biosynthesis